jgi:4,5-DOPA dioxygenase extradiol
MTSKLASAQEPEGARWAPTAFLSHGPPDLAVTDTPLRNAMMSLQRILPRPPALIAISDRWVTRNGLSITTSDAPTLLHDHKGYDPVVSTLEWPARGAPKLARFAAELLRVGGWRVMPDPDRGLDSGVWSPLRLIWPDPPACVQLSLPADADPASMLSLGALLKPLRREGVMVIGLGASAENLDLCKPNEGPAPAIRQFTDWLDGAIKSSAPVQQLAQFRERAPNADVAVGKGRCIAPLLVALGAAEARRPRTLFRGIMHAAMGIDGWLWDHPDDRTLFGT